MDLNIMTEATIQVYCSK